MFRCTWAFVVDLNQPSALICRKTERRRTMSAIRHLFDSSQLVCTNRLIFGESEDSKMPVLGPGLSSQHGGCVVIFQSRMHQRMSLKGGKLCSRESLEIISSRGVYGPGRNGGCSVRHHSPPSTPTFDIGAPDWTGVIMRRKPWGSTISLAIIHEQPLSRRRPRRSRHSIGRRLAWSARCLSKILKEGDRKPTLI